MGINEHQLFGPLLDGREQRLGQAEWGDSES